MKRTITKTAEPRLDLDPLGQQAYVASWQHKLREEAKRLTLGARTLTDLEARLTESLVYRTLPTLFAREGKGELLTELLLQTEAFGAKAAVDALEFTLTLVIATQKAGALEQMGLLGPAPRTALEFALAELLPHLHAKIGGQVRAQLKALLINPPGLCCQLKA